jgi:lipid-A-disaccharide synthase
MQKDIVLVANSPGELSALVKPVVAELAHRPHLRIILVLTPCQYTSGVEVEFSRQLKGIAEIITAGEYRNWAMMNHQPRVQFAPQGVVLFLGGDLLHAMLIAKKLKYPAYAYLNERIAWKNFYRKFFVADEPAYKSFARQAPKGKVQLVGNLMVDSVADLKKWEPAKDVVTFMPGSRKWEIDYMTPFYRQVIQQIKAQAPQVRFQVVSSPFVRAHSIEGARTITFDELQNSELVVTIPGTNTAKIAARGIPMIVVFPLNHPEVIPLEGLADLLGKLPVMGKPFKRWVAGLVNKKTKFFALPNQKAGREIVPEIRGVIEPLDVARKAVELLADREARRKMSHDLSQALGRPGAAKKITEEILAGI